MAPIRKFNSRVQAINTNGGVFGLELLEAVGQFLLQDDVDIGSIPTVANVEDVPIDETIGIERVDLPVPAPHPVNAHVDKRKLNELTLEMVSPFFKETLGVAARRLGVSRSTLMIWCRARHIPRWPYRMIRSMDKLISNVKEHGVSYKCKEKGLHLTLEQLEQSKRSFEKDPSVPIEGTILQLRKIMLKRASGKIRRVVKK